MHERVPPFRSRVEQKRPPSPLAIVFIFLFFMGTLLVLFFRSPLSKIDTIEIRGHQLLSEQEILSHLNVKKGSSYFFVQEEDLKKKLSQLPEVKHAQVMKRFPQYLSIQIQEKETVALFQNKNLESFPLLSDGTVLLKRQVKQRFDVPVFSGWSQSHPTMKQAAQQLNELPHDIRRHLVSIHPVPSQDDQVEIMTRFHHRIIVRTSDLSEKMRYYPSFYQHPPGTIYLLKSIWYQPKDLSSDSRFLRNQINGKIFKSDNKKNERVKRGMIMYC